jgi:O-antigen ligase
VKLSSAFVTFSAFLSLTWLLPNHYPPWSTFHLDAWMGLMLLVAAWWAFGNSKKKIDIPACALMAAGLVVAIGLQFAFDLILLPSTALLGMGYLAAFALAAVLGSHVEQQNPNLAAHVLFLAIGIAAILSVGMQLHQWLNLETELLDIWSMGTAFGRPFANFGQPNQIATFLIWGLLAIAWGYLHKQIRPAVALLAVAFILWGIALSHSRTAWLGLMLMLMASFWWRNLWPNKKLTWLTGAMCLYLAGALPLIAWINTEFGLNAGEVVDSMSQSSVGQRFQAWKIFADAVLLQPWFGYGFDQVKLAAMVAAPMHPAINVMFAQSHNLFFDFVLWFGLPIGLICTVGLLALMGKLALAVTKPEHALLWVLVLVVGNHAMFELPLHYAYFLIPTGVVLGTLSAKTKSMQLCLPGGSVSKTGMVSILIVMSIGFAALIKDYFEVEQNYRDLRFELANFRDQPRGKEPEVLVLTQFRDFVRMTRQNPEDLVSDTEIDRARRIVSTSPSSAGLYKLAVALSLRGENEEAKLWLQRLCKVMGGPQCQAVKAQWQAKSQTEPSMKKVNWSQIEQD